MIMTQEDKELLFKDLCARLPYGVKIELTWWVMGEGTCINTTLEPDHIKQLLNDEDGDTEIKPYLFPLSSMTGEQYNEFFSYYHNMEMAEVKASGDYLKAAYIGDDAKYSWLNENHFDYRGLIEKGLVIDATNLNIY